MKHSQKGITSTTFFTLLFLFLAEVGWAQTPITSVDGLNAMTATGSYIIQADIDASSFSTSIASFSGTLEADFDPTTHTPYRINNLSVPLFNTLTGTVRNLVIDNASVSGSGNTGAIACTANSTARIYNVGNSTSLPRGYMCCS